MESKHKLRHRFDIIRKLGQGTYGKVQLAVNKETGQEVAIKTIKKSKIENEQDAVRIRREIQIMSSIRHPNIVHIYEVFENKDKIVLVMQNASGGELYEYLSERKVLNDAEARRIFRQVVAAVYYIHKNKICHRDLKLENILLDEKGNAKIADFGLSNVYDEKGLLSTFCGSPLYASPEIVKGLPYFGPEVDCWSLGVLLYTLVYGAMPFDGSNFKKLVKQISNGDYFEPKLRSAASGLIRHLLTVNASERASIIDVCRNDWVNETYDTQLLQVAEDLANLSPVRLDLLIALQPQSSTTQLEPSSQQQLQPPSSPIVTPQAPGYPATPNGKLPPTAAPTDRPTELSQNPPQEQILPSSSLMRMPSLSVKNCASLGTLRSSSSTSSVKSALSVDMRAGGGSNHSDDAGSTASCNSFQASHIPVAEPAIRERQAAEPLRQQTRTAAQSTEPFVSSEAAIELGSRDIARMSLSSPDASPRRTGLRSVSGNNRVHGAGIGTDHSLDDQRTASDVHTHNGPDALQHVQIISRKTENPSSKEDSSEDSLRSLVWPAGDDSKITAPSKKPHGRLSPEGAPDDSATERVMRETRGEAVNEVPRGLPMKSYKKFTFERNGGQVVVREKICQKEHRDGHRKTTIEKRVTSRTSSIDLLPPTSASSSSPMAAGAEGFDNAMTRTSRRDDSSDEDDFDIHFDSSHGPLGLLNVMKFMDRDFRTRWQNHPIFQNLSRRPLGMTSELMQSLQGNRRLHSPSLMKMFIERDGRDDDVKSLFERRLSPLLNHNNDRSMFASSLPTDPAAKRNLDRKLSRGSSLDRSSSRTPRMPPVHQQQQSSAVDPMSAAAYEGFSGSFRDIPRYTRTVSDKTIGESQQPPSPTTILRTRTQQGRPSVVHMELNFNTRHPASVGLVHSWSNHGLWQQQNHNLPHQNTTPSRIEMRVHYSTPSSPPPSTPPVGMPPKPPKSTSQEQLQARNPPPPPPPASSLEESVSDRINRRSYYHRFSSVDKQTRPSSTIWDQQGAAGSMSAGAGALWEAASPDKPLGVSSRAALTKPPPSPQESNSTSM